MNNGRGEDWERRTRPKQGPSPEGPFIAELVIHHFTSQLLKIFFIFRHVNSSIADAFTEPWPKPLALSDGQMFSLHSLRNIKRSARIKASVHRSKLPFPLAPYVRIELEIPKSYLLVMVINCSLFKINMMYRSMSAN